MRLLLPRFTVRRMMVAVAVLGVASWAFARYHAGRTTTRGGGRRNALRLGTAKLCGCAGAYAGRHLQIAAVYGTPR